MKMQWVYDRIGDGVEGRVSARGDKGRYEIVPYGQAFLLIGGENREVLESAMNTSGPNGVRRLQSIADKIDSEK